MSLPGLPLFLCQGSDRNGEQQGEAALHHPIQTKRAPLIFNEREYHFLEQRRVSLPRERLSYSLP